MRIHELISEDGSNPSIADVIKTAAQPTPAPSSSNNQQTQTPQSSNLVAAAKNLNKDSEGNKINYAGSVANKKELTSPGQQNATPEVDFTKIPPAQIQQHLKPGTQVNLGSLGKVKVGQVNAQGVEFDGTNTPIGAKFTVPFKTLGSQ